MRKLLGRWIRKGWEAIQRVQQARADREILARLDSRTLRDIGLDSQNAHLAERVEVERQYRLLRLAASRIGMY